MILAVISKSVEDTHAIASSLAELIEKNSRIQYKLFPTCLSLAGELGAGKTEFLRGMVRGFQLARRSQQIVADQNYAPAGDEYEEDHVVSPTFSIQTVYELGPSHEAGEQTDGSSEIFRISHWDLYRLSPAEAELELYDELYEPGVFVVVEWAERMPAIRELMVKSLGGLEVRIEARGSRPDERIVSIIHAPDEFVEKIRLCPALHSFEMCKR